MHLNFMYHYKEKVGKGNPLQYSCLEIYMNGEAWRATAHGVTKSGAQLSMHARKKEKTQTTIF